MIFAPSETAIIDASNPIVWSEYPTWMSSFSEICLIANMLVSEYFVGSLYYNVKQKYFSQLPHYRARSMHL